MKYAFARHGTVVEVNLIRDALRGRVFLPGHGIEEKPQRRLGILAIHTSVPLVE